LVAPISAAARSVLALAPLLDEKHRCDRPAKPGDDNLFVLGVLPCLGLQLSLPASAITCV
jgi:hypothetical protein